MWCGQTGARRTMTRTKADDNVGGPRDASSSCGSDKSHRHQSIKSIFTWSSSSSAISCHWPPVANFLRRTRAKQTRTDGTTRDGNDKIEKKLDEKETEGADNDVSIRGKSKSKREHKYNKRKENQKETPLEWLQGRNLSG